jgi:hypothetical protein
MLDLKWSGTSTDMSDKVYTISSAALCACGLLCCCAVLCHVSSSYTPLLVIVHAVHRLPSVLCQLLQLLPLLPPAPYMFYPWQIPVRLASPDGAGQTSFMGVCCGTGNMVRRLCCPHLLHRLHLLYESGSGLSVTAISQGCGALVFLHIKLRCL